MLQNISSPKKALSSKIQLMSPGAISVVSARLNFLFVFFYRGLFLGRHIFSPRKTLLQLWLSSCSIFLVCKRKKVVGIFASIMNLIRVSRLIFPSVQTGEGQICDGNSTGFISVEFSVCRREARLRRFSSPSQYEFGHSRSQQSLKCGYFTSQSGRIETAIKMDRKA